MGVCESVICGCLYVCVCIVCCVSVGVTSNSDSLDESKVVEIPAILCRLCRFRVFLINASAAVITVRKLIDLQFTRDLLQYLISVSIEFGMSVLISEVAPR